MDLKGNQVIAVDFDGTLCKQAWPEIGEEKRDPDRTPERTAGSRRPPDLMDQQRRRPSGRSGGVVQGPRPDIRHSKREPSGTDRPIQERLQEDKRRHLHRRQGSEPGSVQTRGRNVRFQPICKPDRQGRI